MISYHYNDSSGILETRFKCMIDPKEILEFMQEINKNEELPRTLNVLIDIREADYVFEPISIQHIVKANFRMNRSFKQINNAMLANNPNEPEIALYKQYVQSSQNYRFEIFDDKDEAVKWLKRQ